MTQAKLYNQKGEAQGEVKLNPEIFDVKMNAELVHQVVVAQMANRRLVLAHTKERGDVRGGGKKPWKQKGTGRARAGSSRSPLWRGGGIIFGPNKERNYSKKVNKKAKIKALFMVLSDKVRENAIKVITGIELPEAKTKSMVQLLKVFDVKKGGLIVLPEMDKKVALSVRNLPNVSVIAADSLNVYDVISSREVLIVEPALPRIEAVYLKKQ